MDYVFVKDSEGYVFKKLANEVSADEKIITEKEYMKKSGLAAYEKEFGHGGARENAGEKRRRMEHRKKIFHKKSSFVENSTDLLLLV